MKLQRGTLTPWLTILLLLLLVGAVHAQDRPYADSYGCEANPTGNPIGGGEGYSDIRTGGDFIVRTREELLEALRQAGPGQVVFVPGEVEMDLSGTMGISLPEGVTLAGDRGRNGSAGALLHNRATPGTQLSVVGPFVRITGIRLEGPYSGTEKIAQSAVGIVTSHYATEIDNCEILNWNIRGIGVQRGASRAYIHHNHIHHCQRSGYGYGVSVGGADVFIIANRFDFCRHHIADSGNPGSAYQAAWNYFSANCTSSLVDMHGGRDRGDNTDIAGDWILVHHNTFGDEVRSAVGIRGTPSQGAEIFNNWFMRPPEQTIFSTGNTRVHNNVYGPDQTAQEQPFDFVDREQVVRPEGFSDRLIPDIDPCGPDIPGRPAEELR